MAKVTAPSKASSGKPCLAREEWDFSTCPTDKLYFCFTYEIARELVKKVPAFRARFDKAPASEFDENKNWHYFLRGSLDEGTSSFGFAEFVDAPLGFPHKPYLSVSHKPTRKSYHPWNVGFPFVRQQWPIREVFFDGRAFHKGDLTEERNLLPYDFYSLDIDWNCAPKAITKEFQKWMKAKRPHAPLERRGKSSARSYQHLLKELGGYRLMKAYGKVTPAWNHTIALGVNKGRGLFTQEYEWYEARKNTGNILTEWQQAFEYLEKESFSA